MPGRCGRNSVWWWRRLPASSQARRAWNWTTPTPKAGNLLQPDVRQAADRAGAHQAGSGHLRRPSNGKLRAQGSVCKRMRVSIRTGMFNPDEAHHAQGALVELPYPTCDTLLMTRLATDAVGRIFRPGFRYSKAEVLLMDLRQPGDFSEDLFALKQSVACDRLMQVMDDINGRWGGGRCEPPACRHPRTGG